MSDRMISNDDAMMKRSVLAGQSSNTGRLDGSTDSVDLEYQRLFRSFGCDVDGTISRDVLFELDDLELKALARSLAEPELDALARYITGLQKSASQRVLRAVAQNPAKMQVLASERVLRAVVASEDQDAAVAMMLRTGSLPDPAAIGADFDLVLGGRVSAILLWEKHPVVLSALGLIAALVLVAARRLLFRRRLRPA